MTGNHRIPLGVKMKMLSHDLLLFISGQMDGTAYSKSDAVRWGRNFPAHSCDFDGTQNNNSGGKSMCKIRSIKQTADYFRQLDPETQITEYTIRKLIADGTIPSIKTGNKHLVNLDQVQSLFEPASIYAAE